MLRTAYHGVNELLVFYAQRFHARVGIEFGQYLCELQFLRGQVRTVQDGGDGGAVGAWGVIANWDRRLSGKGCAARRLSRCWY